MSTFNKGSSLTGVSSDKTPQGSKPCALLCTWPKVEVPNDLPWEIVPYKFHDINDAVINFTSGARDALHYAMYDSDSIWYLPLGPVLRSVLTARLKDLVAHATTVGFSGFSTSDADEIRDFVDELKKFNPDAFTPQEESFWERELPVGHPEHQQTGA